VGDELEVTLQGRLDLRYVAQTAQVIHGALSFSSGRLASVQELGLPSTKIPCAQRNRNGFSALNSGQYASFPDASRIGDRRVAPLLRWLMAAIGLGLGPRRPRRHGSGAMSRGNPPPG